MTDPHSPLLADLARIKADRIRKRKSKLDRHRLKIEELRQANASYEDIRLWLRKHRKLNANRSTIARAVKRWGEMPDG